MSAWSRSALACLTLASCASITSTPSTKGIETPDSEGGTGDGGASEPAAPASSVRETRDASPAPLSFEDAAGCPAVPSSAPSSADVDVSIHADRGPHGVAAPVRVDRRVYGVNIADWRPEDYVPAPDATYLAYLAALRPGVLRWPAGHRSQEYVWARGGPGQSGNWTLTPEHVDAFVALARSVDAEPLIGINVKRNTPAAAADFVRFLNLERRYAVRWLYIGNEPDLVDAMTSGPEAYADELVAFTDAIRAVDPSVRFVGPEAMTGAHVAGIGGTRDWVTPVLARAGDRLAGISWHYYPLDSGQALASSSATLTFEHLFQETAADWDPAGLAFGDKVMPILAALRDSYAPAAEIWITEIAEDPGPLMGKNLSDTLGAALWTADALGRYAERGPGAIVRFLYKGDRAHYYALLDSEEKPRPTYGAYWLYAHHFGDRFVDTTSSKRTDVAAHSALRADGALTTVFINKTTSPRRVHVSIDGACVTRGSTLTLEGGGYLASTTFAIDGEPLTPSAATKGIAARTVAPADLFDVNLPPASVRLVVYAR